MKSKALLSFVALTLASCAIGPDKSVFAQEPSAKDSKIIWSCTERYLGTENILWLVEWGTESYIKVFDEIIPASYRIDGLEKRWNWELDESGAYGYSILLNSAGDVRYVDFKSSKDGTAKARNFYNCKK